MPVLNDAVFAVNRMTCMRSAFLSGALGCRV
jgi:hypothetical protein